MSLMKDEELIAAIVGKPGSVPYVEGLALPKDDADRYSKNSPVQASSIDLHIGNIYLPEEKETDLGGAKQPKTSHSLRTGETAIVTTRETLRLPNSVAAVGFPPSSVSFKGLLMTNPGHVDPGYQGPMRFTVINMGKADYPLERDHRIVTVLFFRLNGQVQADWKQRNPDPIEMPSHESISRLSRDFVSVTSRAEEIALKKGLQWSAGIAAVVTVLVGILELTSSGKLFSRDDIQELKKRQDIVEYDVKNRVDVNQKLADVDTRLQQMQQEISELKSSSPKPKTGTASRSGPGGK